MRTYRICADKNNVRIMQHSYQECKFKFERNVLEKFDEYEKSYPVIYKNYAEYEKKQ